jgi:hypothetical protein
VCVSFLFKDAARRAAYLKDQRDKLVAKKRAERLLLLIGIEVHSVSTISSVV